MPNINENPDYQLVMKFLQNIRPGDMDEESANQLMMIGQRIQGGGVLSDREREMFEEVVGATDRFPVEQMDTFPRGGTNPDIMNNPAIRDSNMGSVSDADMRMSEGEMNRSYQVDDGEMQMTPSQMRAMQESGAITPMPEMAPTPQNNVMSLQEAIDAGFVTPTRPQTRPTAPMQSPRPQMRR